MSGIATWLPMASESVECPVFNQASGRYYPPYNPTYPVFGSRIFPKLALACLTTQKFRLPRRGNPTLTFFA